MPTSGDGRVGKDCTVDITASEQGMGRADHDEKTAHPNGLQTHTHPRQPIHLLLCWAPLVCTLVPNCQAR